MLITYCYKCRNKLLKYGDVANTVFEEICEEYLITGNPVYFCTSVHGKFFNLNVVISFLESKGLVVSTESKENYIAVKPLGIDCENIENDRHCRVCFERDLHDNEE